MDYYVRDLGFISRYTKLLSFLGKQCARWLLRSFSGLRALPGKYLLYLSTFSLHLITHAQPLLFIFFIFSSLPLEGLDWRSGGCGTPMSSCTTVPMLVLVTHSPTTTWCLFVRLCTSLGRELLKSKTRLFHPVGHRASFSAWDTGRVFTHTVVEKDGDKINRIKINGKK